MTLFLQLSPTDWPLLVICFGIGFVAGSIFSR